MKKLVFAFALIASTMVNAQLNKFNSIYNQFENETGVTTISVNKGMFSMLGNIKLDTDVEGFSEMVSEINSIKMIIVEDNKKVGNRIKDAFKSLNLEELVSINSEGDKIKFYTENSKDKSFKNLILDVSTADETILMFLDGEIKADDVNRLIVKK